MRQGGSDLVSRRRHIPDKRRDGLDKDGGVCGLVAGKFMRKRFMTGSSIQVASFILRLSEAVFPSIGSLELTTNPPPWT